MRTLVIDNYDSFTYNIVHLLHELGTDCEVRRNNRISLEEVGEFQRIVLSPGPGIPDEAAIMKDVIRVYGNSKNILGVCLGHQGIAEVYGAKLFNLPEVLHGVTSRVKVVGGHPLFGGLPEVFDAMHYHSWAVDPESLNDQLKVTAVNEDGIVMGIAHTTFRVQGVQFHPESILTSVGKQIIQNWLEQN